MAVVADRAAELVAPAQLHRQGLDPPQPAGHGVVEQGLRPEVRGGLAHGLDTAALTLVGGEQGEPAGLEGAGGDVAVVGESEHDFVLLRGPSPH